MINEIDDTYLAGSKRRLAVFLLLLTGAGLLIYKDPLAIVFSAVIGRQDSSHGIFIPFISGYFLWAGRHGMQKIKPEPALVPAGIMLVLSFALLYPGKPAGFQLAFLSYLFFIAALILFFYGKKMFMQTSFPLFFLAAMIPLPASFYHEMAEWMRFVTTWGAISVARIFGAPVYREGYDVYMPGLHLVVNHGCSGIRYLLSLFTFGIVYAVLFRQSGWGRGALILVSIPFAIIASITRLSVVFLSAHYISPFWAEHKPHVFLSWVVFVVFLFGGIALDQFIQFRKTGKETGTVPVNETA